MDGTTDEAPDGGPAGETDRDGAPAGDGDGAPGAGRTGPGGPGPKESPPDRDGRGRSPGPAVTRRQFAAGAGAALLLPVAARLTPWRVGGAAAGTGDGTSAAAGPAAPPTERAGTAAQEGEEEPAGTEALTDYVEARWGDRLSENDLEQIRSSVAGNLRAASSIGEVPLENSDGPAFVFRAYRGDES